jgi:hypothetical protein
MNFQNPYINPYGIPQPMIQPMAQAMQPAQQVVKVNGENGARAYQIGANSSAMLLDESGTLVWLVTTDGAGYKTVSPYDITPHKTQPVPDYGSLESRVKRLEEMIHDATDSAAAGRRDLHIAAGAADDPDDQRGRKSAADAAAGAGGGAGKHRQHHFH